MRVLAMVLVARLSNLHCLLMRVKQPWNPVQQQSLLSGTLNVSSQYHVCLLAINISKAFKALQN
jgi:hypothetical protein